MGYSISLQQTEKELFYLDMSKTKGSGYGVYEGSRYLVQGQGQFFCVLSNNLNTFSRLWLGLKPPGEMQLARSQGNQVILFLCQDTEKKWGSWVTLQGSWAGKQGLCSFEGFTVSESLSFHATVHHGCN